MKNTFPLQKAENKDILRELKGISDKIRQYVLDRDVYCQNPKCKNKYQNLTIHHIIPKSRGGSGENPCNLIVFCWNCHMDIWRLKHWMKNLKVVNVKNLIHRFPVSFYDHKFKEGEIKCSHFKK